MAVLRVGLKTFADDLDDGEISSFRVAEGRELSWGFGDHVYQLFCRTGVTEEACFEIAGSTEPEDAEPDQEPAEDVASAG